MAQSPDKVNAGCSMMSELVIEIYCLNQKIENKFNVLGGGGGKEKQKKRPKN